MNTSPLTQAIAKVGLQPLARVCGVSYQALRKWERAGRLPRTEWTGETTYAKKIAAVCQSNGLDITPEALLIIRKPTQIGAGETAIKQEAA